MAANDKALRVLNDIGNELKLLWWQMEAWQDLFDVEKEKRQSLIQACAPGFFAIVQVTLAESILMRIARLMDSPQSMGQDNSAISNLCNALSGSSHGSLRRDIKALKDEWSKKDKQTKVEQGEYARLKLLRNKWLAHNDWTHKQGQPQDSLWIPLTHDDFELAQTLAGKLWSIYRRASRLLRDTDVIEPQHARLEDRSAELLKRLCGSLFLHRVMAEMPDDARISYSSDLATFESEQMGVDKVGKVFTIDQTAKECGTTGDQQWH